jgi:predicted nucleic acid-binding protein
VTPFVADASITLAWFFVDEATPYSRAVRARLRRTTAVVPTTWPYEEVNSIAVSRRRRRLTEAQADRFLRLLQVLSVEIDAVDLAGVSGSVASLAAREHLTVYDAAYLELAMRRGLALATQDTRLRGAADRLGVPLVAAETDTT